MLSSVLTKIPVMMVLVIYILNVLMLVLGSKKQYGELTFGRQVTIADDLSQSVDYNYGINPKKVIIFKPMVTKLFVITTVVLKTYM